MTTNCTTTESGQPVANSLALLEIEALAKDRQGDYRKSLQRFDRLNAELPYNMQVSCPGCGQLVEGEFDWTWPQKRQITLSYNCDRCGQPKELHYDTVWSISKPDRPGSAEQTQSGHKINPNSRSLPRAIQTLCPECSAVIIGRYFVEDGAVWIEKTCPDHGYWRDRINSDARMFLKAAHWSFQEQDGLTNPKKHAKVGCPSDCGLCGRHQSCACLANIDLTNRCNLNCPICFANANAAGYVYQPSFEQVTEMLQSLRNIRPRPATAVQFSGGEPTVHPQFQQIIAKAKQLGFSNIQVATNGLNFAKYDFARKSRDAGLHTLYLQFDGVGPDVYLKTRNRDIWDKKLQAIENCRQLDIKICLVPTVIKTVNDEQVGKIFDFAVENIDVVSAISYQPVCFAGRMDTKERLQQRSTLGDLAKDIANAADAVVERDFYPLSVVVPLSQLLEVVTGDPKIKPSCHTDCAFGTYFLISPDKKVYPFPKVLDIEAMFSLMNRFAQRRANKKGRLGVLDKIELARLFKGIFYKNEMPPGLTVKKFVNSLQGLVDKSKGRGSAGAGNYRTLMAAGMHFQDRYNYDLERVKRCVIPYATPDGLIPFCAYNSGPMYRTMIERNFAGQDQ